AVRRHPPADRVVPAGCGGDPARSGEDGRLEAGARSGNGPVPERALVLLSRAQLGAGCSGMNPDRRVLLLATTTGYQTRAFGDAARHLGVELVFATDRCDHLDDPWQDGAIPIRFNDEAAAVDAIVGAARLRPFHGVLVVGDRPTIIGALA